MTLDKSTWPRVLDVDELPDERVKPVIRHHLTKAGELEGALSWAPAHDGTAKVELSADDLFFV